MDDYIVENADNTDELVRKVNIALNKGYKLAGGVSTCLVSDRVFFFQALVFIYEVE